MPAKGTLFVIATPIGNLGDMTERALDTLRACDRVLAEDTRRTRQLLAHFHIMGKPVDRFDAHATERDAARVLDQLSAGAQVALVTDAGTPAVSDPGEALVEAAIDVGVRVVPIPGASAVLAALVASGMLGVLGAASAVSSGPVAPQAMARCGGFRFVGFLPRSGTARREAVALVCQTPEAVVLFESPHRTRAALRDLADATPSRRACVARELTKVHEEFVRGTLESLAADPREWLGEIAIVLGAHTPEEREARVDDDAIDARIDEAIARGEHARALAERLAAWSGRPKRELYARVIGRKDRKEK
jgi:16S rRNA (cytidine1402-2'-O)-methyltransferase